MVRQLQILGYAVIAMLSVWLVIIWQPEIAINDWGCGRKCVLQNTQSTNEFPCNPLTPIIVKAKAEPNHMQPV